MRALAYFRINEDDVANSGVRKKCKMQVEAMRNLGVETDMIYLCRKGILKNKDLLYETKRPIVPHTLSTYLFYFFTLLRIIRQKVDFRQYDIIFIRYPLSDPLFLKLLKKAKTQNPSIKILLEIPTYPYDKEIVSFIRYLTLIMDRYYRKKLHHYVDYCVHYGQETEIYQIPVIPIQNGIAIPDGYVPKQQKMINELKLIAVGNWSFWHGLDRLLKGLGQYYDNPNPKTKVTLTIVGGGKTLASYVDLVQNLKLKEQVKFVPFTESPQLDAYFEDSDIGIGSLGMFRKNIKQDSSLKHREYCSRGLPFILSTQDASFPVDWPCVQYFPEEEKPIEIKSIIAFFHTLPKNYQEHMIQYAKEHLSWERQFTQILARI